MAHRKQALLFVGSVAEGRSSGLVDDPLDIKTSNAASVLGGLTLGVVEVSRHCDDCFTDRSAEVGLCISRIQQPSPG